MSAHGAKYSLGEIEQLEKWFIDSLEHLSHCKEIDLPGAKLGEVHLASLIVLKQVVRFKTTALFTTKWVVAANRFGPSNMNLSLKARQALFDRYVILAKRSRIRTELDIAEVRAKLLI